MTFLVSILFIFIRANNQWQFTLDKHEDFLYPLVNNALSLGGRRFTKELIKYEKQLGHHYLGYAFQ